MNGRSGTFSPVSVDGSEWSGISKYQNHPDPSTYPTHPRANLATPPISGSSAGIQHGRFSNGNNRPANAHPGNPSPPSSVARSSVLSDHQRRKTLMMEEALSQHYAILKKYLAQSLRDEKGNAKPNRARDKLLRLSPVQFQELSTDVYDELLRRQSAAGQQTNGPGQVPAYLLPKDNFHPKRNQARQKLATLPPPRFRDLATDVFYELERRFPRFTGGDIPRNGSPAPSMRGPPSRVGTPNGVRPGSRGQGQPGPGQGPGPGYGQPRNASLGSQVMAGLGIPGVGGPDGAYGRPTAKTFQSSTIIPNKSTMVEDDDDQTGASENDDDRSEFSRKRRDTNTTYRSVGTGHERDRRVMADMESQISALQAKVENLESTELRQTRDGKDKVGQEWANLKNSLESKLADAQNLNKNLQTELERVKSNQTATERQLRSELETSKRGDNSENEWKQRYEGLNKAHQDLQAELRQQQTTTREVKQEAAGFLHEMKLLSEQSQRTFEQERLTHQVHGLEEQVKEWKSRYARAKAQLRSLRTSSEPFGQTDFQQLAESGGLLQENGLVQDSHVIEYQVAINELLRSARRSELDSLLPQVRQVVIAVRQISQEVGDRSRQERHSATSKLKSKVSATANNLITASKNFAASQGLSPVSLLDAAASHLSTAMVELIRVVKVRPSGAGGVEDEEEDNSIMAESPAGYYDLQRERISYGGESIYSSASSPRQANGPGGYAVHAKNPYQGLNHPPRDGVANGVKGGTHNTKLGFGIRELEDEYPYEERH
ncbi:component of the polarisome [Xanthoria parietina]